MHTIPFQIFAWIALVFYAFEVIGTKLLSKYEIKNPWLMNFAWSFLVLAMIIPLSIYYHAGMPSNWSTCNICRFFLDVSEYFLDFGVI